MYRYFKNKNNFEKYKATRSQVDVTCPDIINKFKINFMRTPSLESNGYLYGETYECLKYVKNMNNDYENLDIKMLKFIKNNDDLDDEELRIICKINQHMIKKIFKIFKPKQSFLNDKHSNFKFKKFEDYNFTKYLIKNYKLDKKCLTEIITKYGAKYISRFPVYEKEIIKICIEKQIDVEFVLKKFNYNLEKFAKLFLDDIEFLKN